MQKSFPRRAGVLALVLLLCLNLSGCGVFGLVFGLSGAAEGTEVHEDPAEYETLLGLAAAPEGSFFGPELNQGIFPAAPVAAAAALRPGQSAGFPVSAGPDFRGRPQGFC